MKDLVDEMVKDWAAECPELDWSPLGVVVRIQLLGKALSESAEQALAEHDLKLWEYDVLSALRRQGKPYELAASELARASMLTSGTITTRIDGLEQRGLVGRIPDPDDRRSVRVRLTQTGIEAIDQAIRTRIAKAEAQLQALSNRERLHVSAALRKLMGHAAANLRAA